MSDIHAYSRVYSAIYSGVPVYEMVCRGVAVMRRRPDSWLNATQILKVAGIDKGRRTKILEREVLNSKHEKVQGGYGKYQGTCEQYGVMEYLKPIIEYDPELTENGVDQTPTKAELKQKMDLEQKIISKRNIVSANKKRKDVPKNNIMDPPPLAPAIIKRSKENDVNFRNDQAKFYSSLSDFPKNKNIYFNTFNNHSQPNQHFIRPDSFVDPGTIKYPIFPGNSLNNPTPKANNKPYSSAPIVQPPLPIPAESPKDNTNSQPNNESKQEKRILMGLFMNDDPSFIPSWLSDTSTNTLNGVEISNILNVTIDDQGHTAVHWAAALARIEVLDLLLTRGADARNLNFEGESALIKAVQVINNYENQSFHDLLELLHDAIPLTDKNNRSVFHHISLTSGVEGRRKASYFYLECLLGWISRLSGGFIVENSPSGSNGHSHSNSSNSSSKNSSYLPNSGSKSKTQSTFSTPASRDPKVENGVTPKSSDSQYKNSDENSRYQSSSTYHNPKQNNTNSNSNIKMGFFTPQTKSTSMYLQRNMNNNPGKYSKGEDSPLYPIVNNADFLSFLDLKDANGDTALNIAAQFNDRTLIQLLISAGASIDIPNRAGIKPSDFWSTDAYTKNLVANFTAPRERTSSGFDISPTNSTPHSLAPYHSSAPPTTMVQTSISNPDYFVSPTKSSYHNGPNKNILNSATTLKTTNSKSQSENILNSDNIDYRSSRNLATNLELAFKNSSYPITDPLIDQKSNTLPNITSMFKRGHALEDFVSNSSTPVKSNELSDPHLYNKKIGVGEFVIGSQGKKSTLNAIRQLMDDLESEFREQLEKKQIEFDVLENILSDTRKELSVAQENISKLSSKISSAEFVKTKLTGFGKALSNVKPNSYISDDQLKNLKESFNLIYDFQSGTHPSSKDELGAFPSVFGVELGQKLILELNQAIAIEIDPIISIYQDESNPDKNIEDILNRLKNKSLETIEYTKLSLLFLDQLSDSLSHSNIPRLVLKKSNEILREFTSKFERVINFLESYSNTERFSLYGMCKEGTSTFSRSDPNCNNNSINNIADMGNSNRSNNSSSMSLSCQSDSNNKYRNLLAGLLQVNENELDSNVDRIYELVRNKQDIGDSLPDSLKERIKKMIDSPLSLPPK
ncbi:Cell division cycle-related protein res2/pct1 [Smittium culicis]|uniref:Cell division cycle-related protein res2/pct1 n=1 Tax=Smittium culicis TaxID=133412 RepID=A0A1R1YNG2_9FUNG|nr:Cell division cycle-related protein res2/pct1 [Smittium culicis]